MVCASMAHSKDLQIITEVTPLSHLLTEQMLIVSGIQNF